MRLSALAHIANGELFGDDLGLSEGNALPKFSTDSRTIAQASVFIALSGLHFDGHVFVSSVQKRGALAAIVETVQEGLGLPQIKVDDTLIAYGKLANYRRAQLPATVFAITGSCGKTTVKGLLSSILSSAGTCFATRANFNNQIGVPQTIFAAPENCEYLVVEAGTSEGGEISRLANIIDPDIAIVINVNPVHLDGLGSLDGIADEKSDLFLSEGRKPLAVLNAELLTYPVFVEKTRGLDCLNFSVTSNDGNANVTASNISFDAFGCAAFELQYNKIKTSVQLRIAGEHQVENSLAAASAAFAAGVNIDAIKKGLEHYSGDNRRMQRIRLSRMQLIDDSYNASPASVRAAIDVLSRADYSVLVLGDMLELGDVSEREHAEIGRYAAEKSIDLLIGFGDATKATVSAFGSSAMHFNSHQDITDFLRFTLKEGATVLVKGSRGSRIDIVVDSLTQKESVN